MPGMALYVSRKRDSGCILSSWLSEYAPAGLRSACRVQEGCLSMGQAQAGHAVRVGIRWFDEANADAAESRHRMRR